jgi:hypothetical protein
MFLGLGYAMYQVLIVEESCLLLVHTSKFNFLPFFLFTKLVSLVLNISIKCYVC